ncbi:MAG: glycosyltransferase family 2 protein, partial [Bacteroidota bacterium]
RVLRWTITPLCLLLLIPVSATLASIYGFDSLGFYNVFFWLQIAMYAFAFLGWLLEHNATRIKVLFVPYYFFIMNLSVVLGFFRFMSNNQSVNWERAKRAA